jgi:hypothetical protein
VSAALFAPHGDGRWVATDVARGPWDARALHGGPVAALLGRAVEHAPGGDGMEVGRIAVELQRPVPPGVPLAVEASLARPGRKVQLVDATVATESGVVATARAVRIRRDDRPVPPTSHPLDAPPLGPDGVPRTRSTWTAVEGEAFHRTGCEHRFAEGSWDEPGPVAVWIRLLVPVVDGEVPSPLQRVLAAADFGNGVSSGLPFEDWTFINPELTVHLVRPPVDEWVALRVATSYGDDGLGLAVAALYDRHGRIGQAAQALLVEHRS